CGYRRHDRSSSQVLPGAPLVADDGGDGNERSVPAPQPGLTSTVVQRECEITATRRGFLANRRVEFASTSGFTRLKPQLAAASASREACNEVCRRRQGHHRQLVTVVSYSAGSRSCSRAFRTTSSRPRAASFSPMRRTCVLTVSGLMLRR